jgi:hypothetical protein
MPVTFVSGGLVPELVNMPGTHIFGLSGAATVAVAMAGISGSDSLHFMLMVPSIFRGRGDSPDDMTVAFRDFGKNAIGMNMIVRIFATTLVSHDSLPHMTF